LKCRRGHAIPDSYTVYRNIFDNIVTRDTAGEIVPQVATSWTYVDDATIELELRDDITFHDGQPLTAEDVVFSVKRITDPDFASPQLGQFNTIIDAEATGPHTVRLTTDGPYPPLLAQLVKLSVVPKHVVEAVGNDEFTKNPIGSGPYRFDEWQRGVKVALSRNPDYWRGEPPFANVEFRAVPDGATRVADLRSGTADLVVGIDPDQARELEGTASVQVLSAPTERVGYFMMNTQDGPLAELGLRRAVAHALDRELIIDALLGGYGEVVDELLTPSHFDYVEGLSGEAYAYDPDKAKELVAQSGYAGEELVFNTAPPFDQRIVQALQQQLAEVGLNVSIEMNDMPTFLQRRRAPPEQFGAFVFGRWSCACQDADGVLFPMFQSESIWSKYANPEVDRLLEAARSTLDENERIDLYRQVHEILAEDMPSVPLYQVTAIYGASDDLEWTPTANESLFVMDMNWTGE
jgi:peptide/nickel transport system substrate-binding protein